MNKITLYHGSKNGLTGCILPNSRETCDFGSGFYMGNNKKQPLTLICNYPNSKIYTLNLDLTNLKIKEFDIDLDWALFIAYNRGKMDSIKNTKIYNYYKSFKKKYDLIIGYIANDKLFMTLDKFFNGEITDQALINCLSALKIGRQYVAISKKACEQIIISKEEIITTEEKIKLKIESEKNRTKAVKTTEKIIKEYRRSGKYFDEILKEGIINE
ncbi:MAG: DUF3990 domain-containing protein [Bacilli bacterium]|nr:DUF3990 domain-containing protein [Bacilli bacterium]